MLGVQLFKLYSKHIKLSTRSSSLTATKKDSAVPTTYMCICMSSLPACLFIAWKSVMIPFGSKVPKSSKWVLMGHPVTLTQFASGQL